MFGFEKYVLIKNYKFLNPFNTHFNTQNSKKKPARYFFLNSFNTIQKYFQKNDLTHTLCHCHTKNALNQISFNKSNFFSLLFQNKPNSWSWPKNIKKKNFFWKSFKNYLIVAIYSFLILIFFFFVILSHCIPHPFHTQIQAHTEEHKKPREIANLYTDVNACFKKYDQSLQRMGAVMSSHEW